MRDYTLSKEKLAELETLHRNLRDKRQADRVKAVIALPKVWSAAQIAEILLFDETTSRHYFERYQQGGSQCLNINRAINIKTLWRVKAFSEVGREICLNCKHC